MGISSARKSTSVLLQLAILHWWQLEQNPAQPIGFHRVKVVGLEGFEPPTHGLGNRCSILLSYRPTRKWRHAFVARLPFPAPMCPRVQVAPNSRIRLSKAVDTGFGAWEVSADGPCRA